MSEVNSLSIIENTDMTSFKATMSKIGQFQKLVRENLQDGKDYGTIPGTSKPTLYKPGAEKILMLMGLQSTYEIIDSTRNWEVGFFQYQVRCTLKKEDSIITQGLGACNSKENKYAKQNPFNIDNTILKMAKKRSQVDASLTVASLSEIFTQDLEDTGVGDDDSGHHNPQPVKASKAKDEPASDKQIFLIDKQILGSHLMSDSEKNRLRGLIEGGISKVKASETISWWLGKDDIEGERAKREKKEQAKPDLKATKAEKIKIAKDISKGKLEVKDVNEPYPDENDVVEDYINDSDMPS